MFTDDVDQVIVTLGMDLDVGEQLEFVGLQGMDDLGFEIVSSTALAYTPRTKTFLGVLSC